MSDVRTTNAVAIVINGVALAAVLLGSPLIALVLLILSSALIVRAIEKLRTQSTRENRR